MHSSEIRKEIESNMDETTSESSIEGDQAGEVRTMKTKLEYARKLLEDLMEERNQMEAEQVYLTVMVKLELTALPAISLRRKS